MQVEHNVNNKVTLFNLTRINKTYLEFFQILSHTMLENLEIFILKN